MNPSLQIISTDTPDGVFHIITDKDNVAVASGFGSVDNLAKRLPDEFQAADLHPVTSHPYQNLVQSYYKGNKTALDTIPRLQSGSDFQTKVWQSISNIPYGKTISYKQLAHSSGNPTAIRAAGTVCGLNKLILLIPCHRVLKSDGGIGSYLYGSAIKESLLKREGAI